MLSEKQLIKNCQRGVKSSQYELVKRYSNMLMTVCRRYAPDEAIAKDILQETLIRIFKNIDKFEAIGSFEGWMRKIAVNSSLQWLRKSYLKKETLVFEFDQNNSVDPVVWSKLGTEEIIRLIQELPPGFRTVFNLNIIEGYSHKEIGETLGITESASRSQLTRARKLLQKKMKSIKELNKYRSA